MRSTKSPIAFNKTLPAAPPDYTDLFEIPAYRIPRFWVDLIQRQTGKLRWQPMYPARVMFVRYDCFLIRSNHLYIGMKALRDALKVRTTGRHDGIYLHYFGAIEEGPNSRARDFPLRLTVECFIWQLLNPGTSCREVVRHVQTLCRLPCSGNRRITKCAVKCGEPEPPSVGMVNRNHPSWHHGDDPVEDHSLE